MKKTLFLSLLSFFLALPLSIVYESIFSSGVTEAEAAPVVFGARTQSIRQQRLSFDRCMTNARRTQASVIDDAMCYYNSNLYVSPGVAISSQASVGIPGIPNISSMVLTCTAAIDETTTMGALATSDSNFGTYLYDHAMVSSSPCLNIWFPTGTICVPAFTAGPSLHGAGSGTANFYGLGLLVGATLDQDGLLYCDGGWGYPGGSTGGGQTAAQVRLPADKEALAAQYIGSIQPN